MALDFNAHARDLVVEIIDVEVCVAIDPSFHPGGRAGGEKYGRIVERIADLARPKDRFDLRLRHVVVNLLAVGLIKLASTPAEQAEEHDAQSDGRDSGKFPG